MTINFNKLFHPKFTQIGHENIPSGNLDPHQNLGMENFEGLKVNKFPSGAFFN
jgi:hypothetical protein